MTERPASIATLAALLLSLALPISLVHADPIHVSRERTRPDSVSYAMGFHVSEQTSALVLSLTGRVIPPFSESGILELPVPFHPPAPVAPPPVTPPAGPPTLVSGPPFVAPDNPGEPGGDSTFTLDSAVASFDDGGSAGDALIGTLVLTDSPSAPAPEPGTLLLVGGGLAGAAYARHRRRKQPRRA